jgi:hypothetical protein
MLSLALPPCLVPVLSPEKDAFLEFSSLEFALLDITNRVNLEFIIWDLEFNL